MSECVGIIGLGRIGLAAAKAFLRDGYRVYGCDADATASRALHAAGGVVLPRPSELAANANVILILVLNDEQVNEVVIGEGGLIEMIGPESIVICMSTINQFTLTNVASRCLEKKAGFLDCPFTGGPARIANRSLTLIAAGNTEVLQQVGGILGVLGKIVYAGGEPGMGQAIKHCNQLMVGVTHAATMEVIALARKMGLDPSLVSSVIADGIAGSDYFRLLSESVLKRAPSPGSLGQMGKDMSIVKQTLKDVKLDAAVALATAKYFERAFSLGMAAREGADLIEVVDNTFRDPNQRP